MLTKGAAPTIRAPTTLKYARFWNSPCKTASPGILALAMGAGKTVLMGSIVATEFAMAMEYPDGPFVQNALIFAPGKTILSALRELADVPDEKLLPPRMHKPFAASMKLTFTREQVRLVIEVQDVISPSIMQRLSLEQGVFRAQLTDWRAVVDCVLIDPQHDGAVFNVALADVPERKQDLVNGRYELPAPPMPSTVAVKIIDMLGEELVPTLSV